MVKVLHTSDWHLGRELYHQDREVEFRAWIEWLIQTIQEEQIDVVVISGDIFDVINVPTGAQALYYQFLTRACRLCRVFVTSGNHDSGRFIDAPAELMKQLDITVVGRPKDPADEVFVVEKDGEAQLIVCAVPFLRQEDLYNHLPPEVRSDKESITRRGLMAHYGDVAAHAEALRERIGKPVPVLAMGHLMTSGAVKGGDDGVRDLYVGTLEGVDDGIFPATFDYVALGHIHRPQRVNGRDDIRYSGSPIAMGFDERCDEKVVCIVTFDGREKKIETKPVPVFQALQRVSADDVKAIKKALKTIAKSAAPVWLEVQYTGEETVRTLESDVNEILKGSLAKCIHIRNASYVQHLLQTEGIETPELCELEPAFVFESLLKQMRIEGDDAALLRSTYQEALHAVQEEEDAVSQDD